MSSEETDHKKESQDDTAGIKRSYECTFCRRGFTNAQALGGHMNIHRKDRAKAKQVIPNSSSLTITNKFTNDQSMAFPFVSEISNEPIRHYTILESEGNCDMYFHPPAPNDLIRNQPAPVQPFQYEFHKSRSRPMHLNQELSGANLSLRTGPSHVDNTHQVRRGTQKDSEVDLELRLGHDPY